MDKNKILIAYFTRSGNTKKIAAIIQNQLGGTLFQIETSQPLPNDYEVQVQQNVTEQSKNILPQIKNKISNFNDYQYIFVGTPTWNMSLPQAVKSFLNQYNFSDKIVIPFNTNGGYGVGSTVRQITENVNHATVLPAFSIEGTDKAKLETKVKQWLTKIE